MGLDICGRNPVSPVGVHFRTTNSRWGALVRYLFTIAPKIASTCVYWYTSDGDGLNYAAAVRLAGRLEVEIDSGRAAEYQKEHPHWPCSECNGGTRNDVASCENCRGRGNVPNHFEIHDAQDFLKFLKVCGGFSVS